MMIARRYVEHGSARSLKPSRMGDKIEIGYRIVERRRQIWLCKIVIIGHRTKSKIKVHIRIFPRLTTRNRSVDGVGVSIQNWSCPAADMIGR